MSQPADDLTRSELRAIRGHYKLFDQSRAAAGLPGNGTSGRGQPRALEAAVGIEAWSGRSSATRRSHATRQREAAPD